MDPSGEHTLTIRCPPKRGNSNTPPSRPCSGDVATVRGRASTRAGNRCASVQALAVAIERSPGPRVQGPWPIVWSLWSNRSADLQ